MPNFRSRANGRKPAQTKPQFGNILIDAYRAEAVLFDAADKPTMARRMRNLADRAEWLTRVMKGGSNATQK